MLNKKLVTAAVAATLMAGAVYSQAADEFAISGNIALTSDYSVKLTYAVFGVALSVAYVGTTLDEEDVFGTDWAEDTAVFAISKSI